MEVIIQKSELFRKSINSFNQNKLLKFKKRTYNGVETSIKQFENDFAKAKDVLGEFSNRSEDLLQKIKTFRLESENKRELLDSEELYISDVRENDLRKIENNISRFQQQVKQENKELNQEKLSYEDSQRKLYGKFAALKSFVEVYEKNLGLTFEKSKDNNFLVVFEYISQAAPKEQHLIEMRYDDKTDRFIVVRTAPEVPSIFKLTDDLSDNRSFLRFLIRARKEFVKTVS